MRLPLPAPARPGPLRHVRRVRTVAHRGASGELPENTLAAIRRAVELGADLVEVDVQRSKDGVLVLVHDATLSRTTDAQRVFPDRAPWRVGDFTYQELARLDAGSWKSPHCGGEPIPTLAQAAQLVRSGPSGLLLELKAPALYPGVVEDVVATLRGVDGFVDSAVASGRLVVQSFDVAAMKEHKTRAPEVPVGLLGTPARANLLALASWADQVNPRHTRVDKGYVDQVHRLGMACQVWTADARWAVRRALRMGVDGVITNRPEVVRKIIG
jgi:glycerophosphoryl diester phosphodiesterase